MTPVTEFEILRRQVAVSGRVLDSAGAPVRRARVDIVNAPQTLREAWTAVAGGTPGWSAMEQRPGRTTSGADGMYFFLDLPAGRYRLRAEDRRTGQAAQADVRVSWRPDGSVARIHADIVLAAQVTRDADASPLE